MLKTKWKQTVLLALLMGGCFAAGAAASNGIERVDAYLRPDYKVVVEGDEVQLENPVLIYNNSSYLPVRALGNLLEATINWDGQTNTIYVDPRFPGQPEIPVDSDYEEIEMQQPFPYSVTYRSKEYGLLSVGANYNTYYRVEDLALMGIDTSGLSKVRDKYTGFFFVKQEDVTKLVKGDFIVSVSREPVIAGVYDEELKEILLNLAKTGITTVGQQLTEPYEPYLIYHYAFYISAVEDRPNWFYLFSRNERNELMVFVAQFAQDQEGKWYRKTLNSTAPEYLHSFFDNK